MRNELAKRYDRIAERYGKVVKENFWNNALEYPATVAEIRKLDLKGKRALDIGCGSGRYTKVLLEQGAKVWGIENSTKMLEIAKPDAEGASLSLGDACDTKLKTGSFDVIFSGLVLEYLDRDRFFKEANRLLKKNGILLFSMHNPYTELGERAIKGKQVFRFGNYFKEGKFWDRWPSFKTRMCFNHVTMQTFFRAMLRNGFRLEDYIDIRPPPWSRKKFRRTYDRVSMLPPFCLIRARKVN